MCAVPRVVRSSVCDGGAVESSPGATTQIRSTHATVQTAYCGWQRERNHHTGPFHRQSAHGAAVVASTLIEQGDQWVVEADLDAFLID